MELTEHIRNTRVTSGGYKKRRDGKPYIGISKAGVSIPNVTVKYIGLTLNSGLCFAYAPVEKKWFVTFSEPRADNHYGFHKLATAELALGSSANSANADNSVVETLLSPMKDGLLPGRYYLEEPVEEKDQLWYGLTPAS